MRGPALRRPLVGVLGTVAAALGFLVVTTLVPARGAGTKTWSGQNGDPNWTTAGNWVGGSAPSGNADEDLVFPAGITNKATNNDFAQGTKFHSVTVQCRTRGYSFAAPGSSCSR